MVRLPLLFPDFQMAVVRVWACTVWMMEVESLVKVC